MCVALMRFPACVCHGHRKIWGPWAGPVVRLALSLLGEPEPVMGLVRGVPALPLPVLQAPALPAFLGAAGAVLGESRRPRPTGGRALASCADNFPLPPSELTPALGCAADHLQRAPWKAVGSGDRVVLGSSHGGWEPEGWRCELGTYLGSTGPRARGPGTLHSPR